MKIPVYIFTGFLEGGKTHIIQESMEDERFNSGEKTLIILCEEGIEELDPSLFAGKNCYLEMIENEEDFTPAQLSALQGSALLELKDLRSLGIIVRFCSFNRNFSTVGI